MLDGAIGGALEMVYTSGVSQQCLVICVSLAGKWGSNGCEGETSKHEEMRENELQGRWETLKDDKGR